MRVRKLPLRGQARLRRSKQAQTIVFDSIFSEIFEIYSDVNIQKKKDLM